MLNNRNTNNPLLAVDCMRDALKLLPHPQLRRYLLIPLIINLLLYSGAFVLGYLTASNLMAQLIPDWLSWLSWILWPLFFLSFMVIGFFSFTLLANLIAAPYYSQLSAKTWHLLTGAAISEAELSWDKVFLSEIRRIGYLLMRLIPLLLLFLLPGINVIAPALWALFAAWGLAMEFMAYPLENLGLTFPQQKQLLKRTRWSSLGLGGLIGLSLSLPVINLCAGQTAVIAATMFAYRLQQENSTIQAKNQS